MSLRDRCKKFYRKQKLDKYLASSTFQDDLEAFVVTEIGRASTERFDDSVPLVLYFATVKDREEFVDAVLEAGMISKRWPR